MVESVELLKSSSVSNREILDDPACKSSLTGPGMSVQTAMAVLRAQHYREDRGDDSMDEDSAEPDNVWMRHPGGELVVQSATYLGSSGRALGLAKR